MGQKIAVVFLIVVVLGIALYIQSSGTLGKITGQFPSLLPHMPSTTPAQSVSSWRDSRISPDKSSTRPPANTAANIPSAPTSSINPSDIPPGYTLARLSPFFHKITFGTLYSGNAYSYGQISLSDSTNETTTIIDVTGWQIKSNRGGEYIPQAIDLYDPAGMTAPGDILLRNGQTLNIYSNTAPFNLRMNKCIGYLGNANHFDPTLPSNCPYVNQSDIVSFTGGCQQYIYSLNSCAVPDMNNIAIPQNDYACRSYLQNLNYGGCFYKHVGDPDFLSSEWRVWTGSNILDPIHDTVSLFDKNGLLVDIRTY